MARPGIRALLVSAVLIAAGCTAGATAPPSVQPSASEAAATPSASDSGRLPIPRLSFPAGSPLIALPAAVLDPVLADAAGRSGVPLAELVVVTATSRTWPDGSLGCPAPGVLYTQALVEGYQVLVRAGTTLYDYRGAGTTTFKLCRTIPG